MRSDDSSLEPEDQANIKKYADLLLRKAGAMGVFPTPIHRLVEAADLEIARESVLDSVFLKSFYRNLPNSIKLAPDKIKRGAEKLMGLIDIGGATIHIDNTLYPSRKDFVLLHETGHGFLPWQRDIYQIMEDSQCELDPFTKDLFERQANNFASDVLFQLDMFSREAADNSFGILTPIKLAKRYGASLYASIRRFVSHNENPCAVVIFNPPKICSDNTQKMNLRRIVCSPSWVLEFGSIPVKPEHGPESIFFQNLPTKRYCPPFTITIKDRNKKMRTLLAEGFDSTRQVFFLLYPERIMGDCWS